MLFIINVLINLTVIFLMFHYMNWKTENRKPDSGIREFEEDVEKLIIEINRTTERNLQLIEAKIKQLKNIISDAEKYISVIEKEKAVNREQDLLYQKLENRSFFGNAERQNDIKIREKKNTEDNKAVNPDDHVNIREKAVSMYRNGIDIGLIARNLKLPTGEIELMISLDNVNKE